ncbi:MAG: DNA repair protein RecO [Deltaproteobacteria bacterium]|jgi:DNA repair protein RecO (recombination protein O)|nr:DNA repair protein RecO [Deltaproteobacteria bacterium]
MSAFSTPAILIRRTDYGDYDLILTFFSLTHGKISLIAKAAKKSTKRFGGILELFSELEVVGSSGRGRGLPVLQEAVLKQPFSRIRADITRTAYASYWAELIHDWMQEYERQTELYDLLKRSLGELDSGRTTEANLSVLFQIRLLNISGHRPNLSHCCRCQNPLESTVSGRLVFDIARGGITCRNCVSHASDGIRLSMGTLKQLLWAGSGDLAKASRIRFSSNTISEALDFLEAFVPYHLGKQPRSLKFLRQIRKH